MTSAEEVKEKELWELLNGRKWREEGSGTGLFFLRTPRQLERDFGTGLASKPEQLDSFQVPSMFPLHTR